jgi:hypothetical protein
VSGWVRKVRRWGRCEEGSLTLEASMVFPWVLLATLLLIVFSVVITDRVLLYYSASVAAERGAFVWSHSSSDVRSGAYPDGRYDGLYWRLRDDALLAGLFGWTTDGEEGVRISIRDGPAESDGGVGGSLAEIKLRRTADTLPGDVGGSMAYRNRLWKREIMIDASADQRAVSLKAVVIEPPEWIRTFDLARYYQAKMKKSKEGAAVYRNKAAAVLEKKR